jgi:nitrogen-specific signal transduction histidine kinase
MKKREYKPHIYGFPLVTWQSDGTHLSIKYSLLVVSMHDSWIMCKSMHGADNMHETLLISLQNE